LAGAGVAGPPKGTLQVRKLPDQRFQITVRAQGVDPRAVCRLFRLSLPPVEVEPLAASCEAPAAGEVSCSLAVTAEFLDERPVIALMARPPQAADQTENYRPVLSALARPEADAAPMLANFRTAFYAEPRARLHVSGALLADDFNGQNLDTATWRVWQQDAGLSVEQKNGELVVSGRTGKPHGISPEARHRFTGIVSKRRYLPSAAVLLAKFRVPGGLKAAAGLERYMVHFCAHVPDYYTEMIFGREPDGRRGWFYSSASPYGYRSSTAGQWNPDEYQLVRIEHDSARQVSRAYVRAGGAWRPAGEPQKLFISAVQVELKLNIPQDGLAVEARFDDCRLYPSPQAAPVRILVYKVPTPGFVFPSVSVRLLREDGQTVIGAGITDAGGICTLVLPSELAYPIGGWLQLHWNGQDLGRARIPARGVQGLYPGDLWVINAPSRITGSYEPLQ
jgi:hypothetical protein